MKRRTVLDLLCCLLCLLLLPALADASTTRAKARSKAIAACQDKNEGDHVQFINKFNKRIEGVCTSEDGVLIAVPYKK
jgi:hypothetical protein